VSILIRKVDVSKADVQAMLDGMIAACFDPDEWQSGAVPKARTGYWWIAFDDGVPCAFANMNPSVRWEQTGHLSIAGVMPEWRGQGLQKRLIMKRVAYARKLGWHTVITDTINSNAPSMRSLIACGFRPYNPKVEWADKDSSVYWKRATERRAI